MYNSIIKRNSISPDSTKNKRIGYTSEFDESVTIFKESAFHKGRYVILKLSWSFFILYQISIFIDNMVNKTPLCPYNANTFPTYYWYIGYGSLVCFTNTWLSTLIKIYQIQSKEKQGAYQFIFHIVSMGLITTVLSLNTSGGICIDKYNVATNASIWGEWLACGPLLVFIIETTNYKETMSWLDFSFIAAIFLSILCGFLIIPSPSLVVANAFLVLSFLSFGYIIYLPFHIFHKQQEDPGDIENANMKVDNTVSFFLSIMCMVMFGLYSVVYMVAYFKYLNHEQTISAYFILSVMTKSSYAYTTLDNYFFSLTSVKLTRIEKKQLEEEKSNIAKREFLKYVFHEVRTPLNSLTMGIDLLQNSQLPKKVNEYLDMMKDATDVMTDTLNNVLNLQKIEEGEMKLEISFFPIKLLLKKVMNTFQGTLKNKNITLETNVNRSDIAAINADIFRIEHIIFNLVSNAIKFSPQNSTIKLNVVFEYNEELINSLNISYMNNIDVQSQNLMNMKVSVTDQGVGISPENQSKLFNNFVQIHSNILQEGKGSGLGLFICKKLVELHGGTIGVKSELGAGSIFFFTIPVIVDMVLAKRYSQIDKNSVESKPKELTPNVDSDDASIDMIFKKLTSNAKIRPEIVPHDIPQISYDTKENTPSVIKALVVDDVLSNRKMLISLLNQFNIVSEEAQNGQEAIDKIRENATNYTIIFMDNMMPVMNGVEATKLLRIFGFPYIIVGVTGNVMDDDVKEYLNAGADLILGKPLKRVKLQKLINEIVQYGCVSKPGMQLEETENGFQWVPRKL
jgi:signal transduction histidine kinase